MTASGPEQPTAGRRNWAVTYLGAIVVEVAIVTALFWLGRFFGP